MPGQESNSNSKIPGPLGSISSLAKLLPTGTVLAFNALAPSFANNGTCEVANRYLTAILIACCSLACFLVVFTDSFIKDKKLYYGIATFKGLYVFSFSDDNNLRDGQVIVDPKKYKLTLLDFVHAFASLFAFLVFAFGNTIVQECFFPRVGLNGKELVRYLPLGASVVSSLLFMLFPSKRRGIGYAEMTPASYSTTETRHDHHGDTEMTTHEPVA